MKSMITKSSIVFVTSGLLLVSFGHMQERCMSTLAEKYLAGLSDDQLRNLKNQASSPIIEQKAKVAHLLKTRVGIDNHYG